MEQLATFFVVDDGQRFIGQFDRQSKFDWTRSRRHNSRHQCWSPYRNDGELQSDGNDSHQRRFIVHHRRHSRRQHSRLRRRLSRPSFVSVFTIIAAPPRKKTGNHFHAATRLHYSFHFHHPSI